MNNRLLSTVNAVVKLIAFLIFIIVIILSNSIISLIGLIIILIILTGLDSKNTNLIRLNINNLIPALFILLISLLITFNIVNALIITLKYIIFINYAALYLKNTSRIDITDSIIVILKPFRKIINPYRVAYFIVEIMKWMPNYYNISARLNYLKKSAGYNLKSSSYFSNILSRLKNHFHTFLACSVSALSLGRNMRIRGAYVPYTKQRLKLKVTEIDILYLILHGALLVLLISEVILWKDI